MGEQSCRRRSARREAMISVLHGRKVISAEFTTANRTTYSLIQSPSSEVSSSAHFSLLSDLQPTYRGSASDKSSVIGYGTLPISMTHSFEFFLLISLDGGPERDHAVAYPKLKGFNHLRK